MKCINEIHIIYEVRITNKCASISKLKIEVRKLYI